nr:hypothetical protein [uncultured Niameybacter sp.]
MNYFVPRCSKRTLMFIAAIVWMMAGSMIMKLGYEALFHTPNNWMISAVVAIVVFGIFFKFIFRKMARKHEKRIIASTKEKICAFAFFDVKGYMIMAFMMTLGIVIRSTSFINPLYWGPFYVGLGTALFGGGLCFILGWWKWNETIS